MASHVSALYDEDFDSLMDGLSQMYKNPSIARLDVKLTDTTAKIYWVGSILRVDIEGLSRG